MSTRSRAGIRPAAIVERLGERGGGGGVGVGGGIIMGCQGVLLAKRERDAVPSSYAADAHSVFQTSSGILATSGDRLY